MSRSTAASTSTRSAPAPRRSGSTRLAAVQLDGDGVLITVSDRGAWVPPGEPGYRGRGVMLMHALAVSVHIDPTPQGTVVQLRASLRARD